MAISMSDEELYQLTGSWEAAAAMRDEQAKRATQDNSQNVIANTSPTGIAGLPNNLSQTFTSTTKPPATSFAQQYLDANPDVNAEFELFKTKDPARWTPESYAAYHYGSYGKNEDRAGTEGLTGNIDTLTNQILGQNLTSKWTGEGKGSAQANAADMANILTSIGIADIKQFGEVPQYKAVQEIGKMYNGQYLSLGYDAKTGTQTYGTYSGAVQIDGEGNEYNAFVPVSQNAKLTSVYGQDNGMGEIEAIDPSKVTIKDGKAVVESGKTFGNKLTGQAVPNTYTERQTGNAFGGTYDGSGNTGYRVKFAPDGTPVFYTTYSSSNDLVNMFADDPILGAIAQVGAAYFGGPAGTAALNLAMGKDLKDVAKSTLLSYLGNEAFKGFTDTGAATNTFGEAGANFATDIKDIFGKTGSEIIGKTAGQFVANEGNVDIGSLLVNQGVGAATNAVLDQIPDFKTLDPTIQNLVTKTVSNTLSGGPNLTTAQLVSTALTAGLKASKSGGGGGANITNLTEEDIAELNPGELQAYKDKGVQGISDFRKDMKLLGSLSNSGYAGDDLGGNVIENLTNTTTNTGATLNTDQDILDYIDSLGTDTIKDSGLSNQDIMDMIGLGADDTVKVTGDRPTGLGDFMLPTDNVSNVADKGEMVITGNKNGTSLDDFISLNTPAGNITDNYADDTVFVTGNKDADIDELVVTDKKECASGFHDDGTGFCISDEDEITGDCADGYIRDLETGQCVLASSLDKTKVTTPIIKKVIKTVTPDKTAEDLLNLLGITTPGQQASSQDPYAHIKFMEELFGTELSNNFLTDPSSAPKSDEIAALMRLLRNQNV